ncbi:hypothetical protein [Streptomyces sp. NPDC059639]|uniref:hypothetical protein n=1 Tax=Streptomyces sp. NPDC059639 TaxID=3346891 RepID=UPI003689ADB8
MPDSYRYKRGEDTQVEAWIIQGALRIGLEELYQSAAFLDGSRRLGRYATDDQKKAHKRRFAKAARLRRTESLASLSLLWTKMTDAARERGKRPQVEGTCRCAGTGWTQICFDPEEPTSVASVNCPGHNPYGHIPTPVGVFA